MSSWFNRRLPSVVHYAEGTTMPIDPLLNLAVNIATKLLPAAVEQYDKLVKGVTSEHASKPQTSQQPEFDVYKCPSCASESVFESAVPLELVRCWKCDYVFPVVSGYQRCPCGEVWKPFLNEEVIRCVSCQTLIATYESKKFKSCDCGYVFRDDDLLDRETTECCGTLGRKLHSVRRATILKTVQRKPR
jgi:hypothetical protein